jgi:NAD(P)-dependent dehydrogenase (short-subunit alcohol dehydrogenase family)
VADPRAVAEAVSTAHERLGGLDIAINAAGVGMPTPLEDLHPAGWREVLGINLSGTFFVAREAGLRMLDDGGGTIVNVGSELSSIGMGQYSAYCASKFGVVGLTKALAAELAPTVRVNVVCPGPIDTPMMDAEIDWYPDPEATRREAIERVPLKRFAQPEEVVGAIRFLAFEAPFATGAVLPLDGGTTMV